MRVLSIEIQDILSIQKASLTFEDVGLVLVEGWNYDTGRANGAGKTAIFNCLAFGLYDKLPRKITASEILRRGCKTGFVRCSVLCGEDVWIVERSRPKGVKFWKNDVEQNITQDEFESKIRLTYQQFLLTVYSPQANSGMLVRFLSSPDSSKKEFLLQLLNLNKFSDTKKVIDNLIKQRQELIDLNSNELSNIEARIETYEESLIDVDSLLTKINSIKDSISLVDKEIISISNVNKPDLSKFLTIENGLKAKQLNISQTKAKRSLLFENYQNLKKEITDYDLNNSCSYCGSSLDSEVARHEHDEHQKKIKQKLDLLKSEIDNADIIISEEKVINDTLSKLDNKKAQESSSYQKAQIRLNELKSYIKTQSYQIDTLQSKVDDHNNIFTKIDTLKLNAKTIFNSIVDNKRELELYKTLSTIYSPTGAQAYVLDSIVDSFNEVVQKYIDMMSPNISYVLNSFKENTKGDVVAKFSETLTKAGTEVSVGSLSGGEEKGLSLCVDFALLEVLETQFGMSLNPIILDEPFDSLDASGREIVINLLENLAQTRQIFIVDHSSEAQSMFTKILRVELRNDVSSIT